MQQQQYLPAAPPPRMPPPPPPPPPPVDSGINISRRGLAGILIGGSLVWYALLNGGVPMAGVDRKRNIVMLRTKGGNVVAATQDSAGRTFLFDKAGNIYYDTEDPKLGIYIVDTAGEMYNEYLDLEGAVQRVPVGNIGDLRSLKVDEIGGVSMRDLQRAVRELRGGRIVGFPRTPVEGSWEDLMPPNAPASLNRDGTKVEPPPILEDWELDLEPRRKLFGGGKPITDPAEALKGLRRQGE